MFFLGLVSSDTSLCQAISEQLKQADVVWQHAALTSLDDALGAWSDKLPSIIMWDSQTAFATDEMIGFFAHRLGQAHPSPILMVLGTVPAILESFGVTEVYARPLRLGYLLTRLQFYQRLLQQSPDISVSLGPWFFAPRSRTLIAKESGEEIKLTDKESALLEYLYAAHEPVLRDELLAAIWGYEPDIDTHTLETHIYRLRRKLMEANDKGEDVFVTEGGGYQVNPIWRGG